MRQRAASLLPCCPVNRDITKDKIVNFKNLPFAAALLLCAAGAVAADNDFRIGVANIAVHSKSDNLTSNGPAFLTPQPAGVTVENATTLLLGYTRHLNANWDFDVLLGVPPTHSVKGTGTLAPFGEIARIKQAGPTAMINYNFGAPTSVFRPYVGLGVNFTHFYNATSTASGNIATGGPTKISLTNSVGLAGQVGGVYKLNEMWSLNGSIAAAKVLTDLTSTTGSIERKTTLDLRPVVYSLAVGYAF
jgi:outer membrane protein